MAIRTTFELVDIIGTTNNYQILATDKNGHTQTIISSADARRYLNRKYGLRKYALLTGSIPATVDDAKDALNEDFDLWVKNRQHNIDMQYQALFDYDYSPIENYDRFENATVTTDGEIKYGKVVSDSGSDSTTYGKEVADTGTDETTYGKIETESGTDETTYGKILSDSGTDTQTTTFDKDETDTLTKSGSKTVENQKAGFNAPNTYTPSEKTTESYTNYSETNVIDDYSTNTETTVHGKRETASGSDSVDYGKTVTDSGSDSITYGKTVTESGTDTLSYGKRVTDSGKDENDETVETESHIHGNIGVTTSTAMIEEVVKMRLLSLAEMLLDNFVNDYTFYC